MSVYALVNGKVVIGKEGKVINKGGVVIKDSFITDVGSAGELEVPDDAKVVDVKGYTIMPGMIDAHIHITGFRSMDYIKEVLLTSYEVFVARGIEDLKSVVEAGFTSICDAGSRISLNLKEAESEGTIKSPRIFASGYPISQTFGHGDIHHLPINLVDARTSPLNNPLPSLICDGESECRKASRYALRMGADFIKIFATGGVASQRDRPEYPQLTDAEIKCIVEEAERAGRFVHAHAEGREGIINALKAGVKIIAHGIYIDEEGINLAIEKNATLVPTLTIADLLVKYGGGYGLPEWALKKMEEVHDIHVENIRKAYRAGVRLATGTDLFIGVKDFQLYGMNALELKLFVDLLAMSPLEALEAATGNASYATGKEMLLGTLEKGKYADVIVVGGDPTKDISLLIDKNNVKMVFKGGIGLKDKLTS